MFLIRDEFVSAPVVVFESDAGGFEGALPTSGVVVGAEPGVVVGTAESNDIQ